MKLSIIGMGQCGSNIADIFYDVNRYSRSYFNRRISIVTDSYAVNTDEADLGGLRYIPRDKEHRILIGKISTYGHGVGKINTDASNIIKSANSIIVDTVFDSPRFMDSDAVLVIASSGGGTGSGVIGWMVKTLKERTYKPVYAMLVLPFAFEEKGKASYAVINSATCLNTVGKYADAVFLFDNESHRKVKISLSANMRKINEEIALNFYDLCCAGEENHPRYIGSKVVDAGDIKQSLSGVSVIGRGQVNLPAFRWAKTEDYRQEIKNSNLVFGALHKAEVNLGVNVDLQNARKILVLVTCPKDYLSTTVMEEIFGYFEQRSPKAEIRIGDYPRRDKEITVTLIASEFVNVGRIERLINQAEGCIENQGDIGREKSTKIELMKDFIDRIPSLD